MIQVSAKKKKKKKKKKKLSNDHKRTFTDFK